MQTQLNPMVISYVLNKGAELLGKKWRAVIIWHLKDGPQRFSQLKRKIPEISVKVLSEVLQEMEENDMVIRKQYNTIPVKVTYELHPNAVGFVDTNEMITIKLAEYLVANPEKTNTSLEMVEAIQEFLTTYRKLHTLQ